MKKADKATPGPRARIDTVALYALPSRQQRSAQSVLKIIEAAEHVLCAHGLDGFSMAAVAAQADLSVGGLYRRFATKEDLLATVNDLALKRARERFEAAITRAPLTSAEAVVQATVEGLCAAMGEEEALHRTLFNEGRRQPALFRRGLESRSRSSHAFYIMLLPYLRSLNADDARFVILMIWEVIMGGVLNKLDTQSDALHETSWPAFREELTKVVIAYLRTQMPPDRG